MHMSTSVIYLCYDRLRNAKEELDNYNGSQFQKLLQARNYRRMSNNTFKAVKVNLHYHETGSLF